MVFTCPRTEASPSPETTLVVINGDSPLSLTVANHWLSLRPIPQSHMVVLHNLPSIERLSMEDFVERILKPIRRYMERMEIDADIDTIVYSADFPFAVDIQKTLKKNGISAHRYLGGSASITALTYFSNQVLDGKVDYIGARANDYYRRQLFPPPKKAVSFSAEDLKRLKKEQQALKKGDADEALRLLRPLLQTHGDHPRLRIRMAEVLAQIGRKKAALEQLEAAVQLGYDNSLTLRNDKWLVPLKKTRRFLTLVERIDRPRARFEPPLGFAATIHWSRGGLPGGTNHDQYKLSALLAYTGQHGNSLNEIQHYLSRAAHSDATRPKGTVYLMENDDVRTETRQPWFAETCGLLRKIGHRCAILTKGKNGEDGILPRRRKDIIGLVAGTRNFRWKNSGSRMLPGAIAESFTSYGAVFDNDHQTKLTEFLRQGAAGSSGAVTEPYAFAEKFPLPLMHYYYALGYSLGESWYMAVASPYQALLVGDPLTRPFSGARKRILPKLPLDRPWRGTMRFPTRSDERTDHLELWVDGRIVARALPGKPLIYDTKTVGDGYHELHLVAVEKAPRRTRTTRHHWIRVDNHGLHSLLKAENRQAPFETPFMLAGSAPPASQVAVRVGTRTLIELEAGSGAWETILPSSLLGLGQVTVQAVATTPRGRRVFSNPVPLKVTSPHTERPRRDPGPWQKGLRLTYSYSDGGGTDRIERTLVTRLDSKRAPWAKKAKEVSAALFTGQFQVKKRGFHQLALRLRGPAQVRVDGREFTLDAPVEKTTMRFLPLFLDPGWHELEIRLQGKALEGFQAVLSGVEPPTLLEGDRIRSPREPNSRRRSAG